MGLTPGRLRTPERAGRAGYEVVGKRQVSQR
jgi:hypothetical protein